MSVQSIIKSIQDIMRKGILSADQQAMIRDFPAVLERELNRQ
ncbi:MAG: hypothetical protein Q8R20_01940 [Nanoarchaeota archaeon]|nr:hypothetical protein [Nanoarchaeota archaeon]